VSEDETLGTAAEIRALAEEAEAEAAEAEALAAAARARVRALQLRRKAERAEAEEDEAATKRAAAAEPTVAEAVAGPEPDVAADVSDASDVTVEAEAQQPPSESRPKDGPLTVETKTVEIEASPDEATKESAAESAAVEETEADDEVADEDEAEESELLAPKVRRPRRPGRWRRRPNWSTVATAAAVLIVLVALVLTGLMVVAHRNAEKRRQQVAEFAAAARQGVVTLTSLNFQNAKQDIQRIVDDSTGSFRDDLLKMAGDFNKVVEESKVVEQGSVQAAAVDLDSMTNDSAVVYVASTSEVTNAAGAKQDPRNYRLIVTITRDGGQLKMSKVEFVP